MSALKVPADLKYTKTDEWVKLEGSTVTIGITDYAQNALNDIVFVELPGVGDKIGLGDKLGMVESVKAASDIYSPVAGEVTAINDDLDGSPEKVNEDPYEKGWFVKLKVSDSAPLNDLMDAAKYQAYCDSRDHV